MTLHNVFIALGSNTSDRKMMLTKAFEKCKDHVVIDLCSPVIETTSVGGGSAHYLNQMVCGKTSLTIDELTTFTKRLEDELGRDRTQRENVAIDIDIMLYDQQKLHSKDWERDYIKQLLTLIETQQ